MSDTINKIDLTEFRELGLLQEVNRLFFHPRGLALEMVLESDGTERFGGVWDYRHDSEGIIFADTPDSDKAARVARLFDDHADHRRAEFGWTVQPAGDDA